MDNQIIDFLLKAKKATYAGKGAESTPSRPNSHDLEYEQGSLKYIDTYLGEEKFAGEEALWNDGVPFWAMNYVGRVIGKGFSGDFLKEALSHVSEDNPYRGPEHYENDGYVYKCVVNGDFHWFSGAEEILLNGVRIYECIFHGGDISSIAN